MPNDDSPPIMLNLDVEQYDKSVLDAVASKILEDNRMIKEDQTPTMEEWVNGKPIIKGGQSYSVKRKKAVRKRSATAIAPQEIASRLRTGFWNGMVELCRRQAKTLDEVMADWLETDPQGTFKMVAPFFPKQIEANVKTDLVSFLREIETRRGSLSNQPTLPKFVTETIESTCVSSPEDAA